MKKMEIKLDILFCKIFHITNPKRGSIRKYGKTEEKIPILLKIGKNVMQITYF